MLSPSPDIFSPSLPLPHLSPVIFAGVNSLLGRDASLKRVIYCKALARQDSKGKLKQTGKKQIFLLTAEGLNRIRSG